MRTFHNILVTGGAGFIGSNFIRYLFSQPEFQGRVVNLDLLTYAGNLENLADIEARYGERRARGSSDSPDGETPNFGRSEFRPNTADLTARYIFVQGDIRDRSLVQEVFQEYEIDCVVHFAAESHVDRSILGPEAFITTNVLGTYTLLDVARHAWKDKIGQYFAEAAVKGQNTQGSAGVGISSIATDPKKPGNQEKFAQGSAALSTGHSRPSDPSLSSDLSDTPVLFHHISTDEVYGSLGETGYFTESTPYDPRSPYSASKAGSDHLVMAYYHTYGLPVTLTNCSNNYGPYQFPEKLIPLMILNVIEGKPLPVYGDGKNIRDWLYVEDHAAAVWRVIQEGRVGETYNIGGENEWENIRLVHRLIEIVAMETGKDAETLRRLITFVKDRPGHDRRYAIDCSKIKQELGWKQSVSFEEGLRRTVRWYLTNQGWVDRVRSGAYRDWIRQNYEERTH